MPVIPNKNIDIKSVKVNIPWFMWDFRNKIFITSGTIPGDITDTKEIALSETPIPGLNYSPIYNGGGGNRKVSFSIPIIVRNEFTGNILQLAMYHNLRQNSAITGAVYSKAGINKNPSSKVLFYYGTGFPSIWYIKKCDFVHKAGWVNALGNTKYTEVQFELWQDEESALFKAEEIFRRFSALAGMLEASANITLDYIKRFKS